MSGNGSDWVLLNASPDLRQQMAATVELHPHGGIRSSPIAAVVLTGAEIDQTAGLLNLRERQVFDLFATAQTLDVIAANPVFDVLARDVVGRRPVRSGEPFDLPGGLRAELFLVPGKVPLYLEGDDPDTTAETEANVGIEISIDGRRLVFVPGCGAVTSALEERLGDADIVLFDATLFTDDEMVAAGTGSKTGRRMGHIPIGGTDGSLATLSGLESRRIYIHINNTNPILIADSPQRRMIEAAGWDIAFDGMRIEP